MYDTTTRAWRPTARRVGSSCCAGTARDPVLAAEPSAPYDRGPLAGEAAFTDRHALQPAEASDSTAALSTAVSALTELDWDALNDAQVRALVGVVQREADRLAAVVALGAGTLRTRAARAAGTGRAGERAGRQVQEDLAAELQLTPAEAKRMTRTGQRLRDNPTLREAATGGRLRPEQATVITGLRTKLLGHPDLDQLEAQLVAAAAHQDAVELGRTARRLLAEADQHAAVADLQRRRVRRRGWVAQDADGSVRFGGQLDELDGEIVQTAIFTARRPDAPDEHRSPEQATADAIVDICRAYLNGGHGPSDRRVTPHLVVTVPHERLEAGSGAAETRFSGPVPTRSVRPIVRNATIHVLGTAITGLPISLAHATATTTASQYLALAYRDGGCRWPGCDRPPQWCDVAHAIADAAGGPRRLDNLLLLCRRHHRKVDEGHWTIRLHDHGAHVTFTPPDGRSPVHGSPATCLTPPTGRDPP